MFWLHVGPWVFWEWESSRMTIFWNLKKHTAWFLALKTESHFALEPMWNNGSLGQIIRTAAWKLMESGNCISDFCHSLSCFFAPMTVKPKSIQNTSKSAVRYRSAESLYFFACRKKGSKPITVYTKWKRTMWDTTRRCRCKPFCNDPQSCCIVQSIHHAPTKIFEIISQWPLEKQFV